MAIYNYRTSNVTFTISLVSLPLRSSSWEASKRLLIKYISGSSSCWGKAGTGRVVPWLENSTWGPELLHRSMKPIIESCVLYYLYCNTILLPFATTSCHKLTASIESEVTNNLKQPQLWSSSLLCQSSFSFDWVGNASQTKNVRMTYNGNKVVMPSCYSRALGPLLFVSNRSSHPCNVITWQSQIYVLVVVTSSHLEPTACRESMRWNCQAMPMLSKVLSCMSCSPKELAACFFGTRLTLYKPNQWKRLL